MSKFYISQIDSKVNKAQTQNVDTALDRIQKHIIKKIDPTFPVDQFKEWYDSDTDEPFRWNKNRYYWSEK